MGKIALNIKRMLDALAYADAGEYLTLHQKARHLSPATEEQPQHALPIAKTTSSARKWIGLYLGSELPRHVMDYVLQTCQRMRQGLLVLTLQDEQDAKKLVAPLVAAFEKAGLDLRVDYLSGEPLESLTRYLRRHPEISFLTCNESGFLGRGLINGIKGMDNLPVPVVLVTPRDSQAAIQQDAPMQPASRTA